MICDENVLFMSKINIWVLFFKLLKIFIWNYKYKSCYFNHLFAYTDKGNKLPFILKHRNTFDLMQEEFESQHLVNNPEF